MIRNVMATFKLLVLSTLLLSLISISACRPRQESLRSDPVYAAIPKDGPLCFLGASDPTMNSAESWSQAADDAVMKLFFGLMAPELKAGYVEIETDDQVDQVTIQKVRGSLPGARVLGWWFDADGRGPKGAGCGCARKKTVWAVACLEGYEYKASDILPEAFSARTPSWVKNVTASREYYCSLGVSGATMVAEEARDYAIEDARHRLAVSVCARGNHAFIDYLSGSGGTWVFPEAEPTDPAMEYVAGLAGSEDEKVSVWVDESGNGPLKSHGAVYARVCVPRVRIPCGVSDR